MNLVDHIPEREWRLLEAVARKTEEINERERLAEEFQKIWMKEKEEKQMMSAEMSAQYKRYLHEKRCQERCYQEYKRSERAAEMNAKRGDLINSIRHKEMRSADLLASREDQKVKTTEILSKAILEKAKALIAAERRSSIGAAEEWKHQLQLANGIKKARDAEEKRNTLLREASRRLAINRALNNWETMQIRQDVAVEAAIKRAHAMASSCLAEVRSARIQESRADRVRRARQVATITAQMREIIKSGRH